jgi:hypothetical protein
MSLSFTDGVPGVTPFAGGVRGVMPFAGIVALLAGVVLSLGGMLGPVSGASAAECANEAFRTGSSAGLPDCRAYELVSPPDKNGGEVDGGLHFGELAAPAQAAADGEAVTYGSSSSFLESTAESALVTSQYISTRTPSGWQTKEITPKQQVPSGTVGAGLGIPDWSLFQGFSEDLGSSFLLAFTPQPDPSAPEGFFNPYLRNDESSAYQLLSSATPPVQEPFVHVQLWAKGFGAVYAGMSADGQHVIFEANDALTPEAVPGKENLYEWSEGRPLELVSVLPTGEVYANGQGTPLADSGPLRFGMAPVIGVNEEKDLQENNTLPYNYSGALSSNGMRAFWTGGDRIYMHEITASGSRTVEVSASQKGSGGVGSGAYWTANPSGSLVYFTSSEQLTDESTQTTGADLYQYNVETGVLHDLTVDRNAGESAAVQGVLGSGEAEGVPYVYFVARGALDQAATAGAENLYLWRGGASEPVFIARLGEVLGEESDFSTGVMARTSRVSPDGELLAFQSAQPLTGYDNVPASGACPPPQAEGDIVADEYSNGCMEVFEYDARTGRLVCASCDSSGLPPTGESIVPETPHVFENVYGWESSTVQQRYLLDDGRLFFDSEDALLPQATDGKQNVYEYEPEGVGQCAAGTGGCQYLLSTGTSSRSSAFLDASADGRDVFILTSQQLVRADGDEAIDVYDAREGGGFSEAQPPPCSGEACRPPVTPAPAIYGAPPSATFLGAGNTLAASLTPPANGKRAASKGTKGAAKRTKAAKKQKRKGKPARKRKARKAARRVAGVASKGRPGPVGAHGSAVGRAAGLAGNGGAR